MPFNHTNKFLKVDRFSHPVHTKKSPEETNSLHINECIRGIRCLYDYLSYGIASLSSVSLLCFANSPFVGMSHLVFYFLEGKNPITWHLLHRILWRLLLQNSLLKDRTMGVFIDLRNFFLHTCQDSLTCVPKLIQLNLGSSFQEVIS
jgi:hypothetical protein